MKLSTKRRRGHVHVKASGVYRVAKEHAVPTSGWSSHALDYESDLLGAPKPEARFEKGQKWVYCKPGDLAIEVVMARSEKLVGYSYFSGDAIQIMRYAEEREAGYFGQPEKLHRLEIPDPYNYESNEQFSQDLLTAMLGAKYGMGQKYENCSLYVFELRVPKADLQDAVHFLAHSYSYSPVDSELAPRAHILGLINAGKRNTVTVHFQPPGDKYPFAATGFQISLLQGLAKCTKGCAAG